MEKLNFKVDKYSGNNAILRDEKGFTLMLPVWLDKDIVLNIPRENNRCVNWNDNGCWDGYVTFTIDEQTITVRDMEKFLKSMEKNEEFLTKGLGLVMDEDYFKVISLYEYLLQIATQLMEPIVGHSDKRYFKLIVTI